MTDLEPAGWQWCKTHHFRKKLPKDAEKYCWEAVYTATQMREYRNAALEEAIDKALSQPVSMEPWGFAGAMPPEQEEVKKAAYQLAPWLSAALDDPNVCKEYKEAINAWFDAAMPAAPEPVSMEPACEVSPYDVNTICWNAGHADAGCGSGLFTATQLAAARQQDQQHIAELERDKEELGHMLINLRDSANAALNRVEKSNAVLLEALKEALEIMKADWQQIDQEWGPSEGGLEAAMDGRLTGYGYFQKAIAAIQAAEVKP